MLGYQIFRLIYCQVGNKDDFHSAQNEEVLKASLTKSEWIKLTCLAQRMKNAKTLAEFLRASICIDEDALMQYYGVSGKQLGLWKRYGIDEYTKQMLAYAILSDYLAASRFHGHYDDWGTSIDAEGAEWDV